MAADPVSAKRFEFQFADGHLLFMSSRGGKRTGQLSGLYLKSIKATHKGSTFIT